MVENFADHPRSIAEIRSDKSLDASDWTPRDALIKLLRMHDSGEQVLTTLVAVYAYDDAEARHDRSLGYTCATKTKIETLGLLGYAQVATQRE